MCSDGGLPLDDKLDRVAVHSWEWWWVSIWELVGLFLVTGGLAGLTYLLAAEDEPVLASVAFGGYLVALVAWVFGLIAQAAAVFQAATQRTETGETPRGCTRSGKRERVASETSALVSWLAIVVFLGCR